MFDVALKSAGAQVVLATSSDDKYPPENIIDGDSETFWTTTGLFPQEFVIKFTSMMNMSKVELASCNEINSHDGQLQSEEINLGNIQAQHLRVVIDSAYDHFAAVYRLHVDGTAAH
ncbi:intraflagellar transport protein 25 homolog isoform X2 [Mytilus galloprovincialis]|uniref:intraflagellar transport protein 25 homolog isoform X2 n=1 Tax=Mytilus galloprovincialis TaxID=29158 RepID=UPI003F7C026E